MSARMMQGDCPKGYKKTEVGVIPEDWVPTAIGNIAPIATGSTPPTGDSENYGDEFLFVSPADMGSTKYISVTGKMLSKKGFSVSRQFPAGSILFVCIGSTIGKCGIASETLTSNQQINAIFPVAGNSPDYLYYAISAASTSVKALAGEQAVPIVNKSQFAETKIPLPPTKVEQEAIAEVLSDADALIESLEQLIAKKRQVKQGAMQELLTGKRRLPGFSGEWVVKTLLALANGRKELFDDGDWIESEHITSEGIRLVQTGNIGIGDFIEKEDKKYIYEESFVSLRCKEIQPGDLLICRLAEPAGRACVLPDIGEEKMVTSVDVTIFRPPTSSADRTFLANIFSTSRWFREVAEQSGGTTHKRISRGSLGRMKILLPPKNEQTAITAILSDMDAEIAELEAKLAKARQVKQGMMQELLTGRIRLV